jgi:TonB family protein
VNEAVDRVIIERARLDAGLSNSLFVSLTGHAVLVAAAIVVPMLAPRAPVLNVTDGFAVVLPRGGGGSPNVTAPPAAKPEAKPEPPAPAPPVEPPKVLKPPREQAPPPDALPEPDARRTARKATPPPPAPRAASSSSEGESATTPGLEFGPPGPGVPGGTDSGGDWYMAGVQQKIWILWNQQIKSGFTHPIGVTFTILADGRVSDVKVTQPSGASLLDMAAQRAILNAAPFGPLPRQYGTDRKSIQAVFRPTDG